MKIGYLMQAGVPDIREEPPSGPANHVKQVFYELQGLGHEVRLVAQLDGHFWASDDLETLRKIDVSRRAEWLWRLGEKVVRRIQSTFGLPYAAWFESRRFAQACQQELAGFNILYERMGWMGYGGSMAARTMRIPWVLEVNGDHLDELKSLGIAPKGGQKWLSMWVMRQAIRRAAHVVAVGEGWKLRFLDRWAFAQDCMSVVENGSEMVDRLLPTRLVTHRTLHPYTDSVLSDTASSNTAFPITEAHNTSGPNRDIPESAESKPIASARSSVINILYIGGFEPWHGVTVLLEAVAKAAAQNANIHLHLIGSGSEQERIKSLIQTLELDNAVTLTGYLSVDEMIPYLEQAEIGVCPYCGRANFSGLKILDYKAAGLATIASGQNGDPSILAHGKTGLIVPPGNVDALASAILELCGDLDRRRSMGQAARAEAEQLHRWRHTAQKLEEIFIKCKQL